MIKSALCSAVLCLATTAGAQSTDGSLPDGYEVRTFPVPLGTTDDRVLRTGLLMDLPIDEVGRPIEAILDDKRAGVRERVTAEAVRAILSGDRQAFARLVSFAPDDESAIDLWWKITRRLFRDVSEPVLEKYVYLGNVELAVVRSGDEGKDGKRGWAGLLVGPDEKRGYEIRTGGVFDPDINLTSALLKGQATNPEAFAPTEPPAGAVAITAGPFSKESDLRLTLYLPGRGMSVFSPLGFELPEDLPEDTQEVLRFFHKSLQSIANDKYDAFAETLGPADREEFLGRIEEDASEAWLESLGRNKEVVYVVPGDPVTTLFVRPLSLGNVPLAEDDIDPVFIERMPEGTLQRINILRAGGLSRLTLREDFRNEFKRQILDRWRWSPEAGSRRSSSRRTEPPSPLPSRDDRWSPYGSCRIPAKRGRSPWNIRRPGAAC